jgi:hypothetical protein
VFVLETRSLRSGGTRAAPQYGDRLARPLYDERVHSIPSRPDAACLALLIVHLLRLVALLEWHPALSIIDPFLALVI